MKDQEFINGAEFGRRVGVKKAAISRAISRGAVIRQKKGIDPLHPLNLQYAESIKKQKEKIQTVSLNNTIKKELSERKIEDQPPESELQNYTPEAKKSYSESTDQKNALLKAQTSKAQIELAKLMGVLVLRKDVELFWGRVIGSLHTYIMPLDERLSNDVSALCEVTKPEIVLQVKEIIKKEIVTAMAQVQNTASEFSAILTSSS
jgi:hypothetical protein